MIRFLTLVATLLAVILFGAIARAQSPPEQAEATVPAPPTTIKKESLAELLQKVEGAPDLDEVQRRKIQDTLQKASTVLSRAEALEAQTPLDQAAIENVSLELSELQARLATPSAEPLEEIDEDATLAELTAALASRQPRLQKARKSLEILEAEPARRIERRTTVVGDQASHQQRKDEIEKGLKATAPLEESPLATSARKALLLAKLREVTAEGPAFQAELSKYDAAKATDLPALRIQLAQRDVSRLLAEAELLNKRITDKRSNDARYITEQLQKFAAGQATSSPYLNPQSDELLFDGVLVSSDDLATADETARIAVDNLEATAKLTRAVNQLTSVQEKLINLRSLKTRTQERIDRVGLTGAIGLELRRQLRLLADSAEIRQQCRQRQEEMQELEFERLDTEDQTIERSRRLNSLRDKEYRTDDEDIELRLTYDRHAVLTALGNNYGEYFNRLGEIDATEQERIREIDEFRTLIRELVLWIRSNRLPGTRDVGEIAGTVQWFLAPANWQQALQALWTDVKSQVWLYILITILVSLLFIVQPRFRRNLTEVGDVALRPACRDFSPTTRASVLTAVIATAWPVLPAFFSWRLLSDATASPFALAVGRGLQSVAIATLTLSLLRTLCRPGGLGLAHFDWPTHTVKLLRTQLQSLMAFLLPLLFVESTLHAHENPDGRDALERIVFVVSLLVLAWFQYRIAHPQSGIFRDFLARHNTGWAHRLRWFLYGALVALPIALAALAIVGYYYTAYELSWRLHVTTWTLIGLIVLRSYLIRWFVVSHRRLRMEEARQRRQSLLEEQSAESGNSNIPKPVDPEVDIDLKAVSLQTQRFIDSGLALFCLMLLWFVWVNVLPALGVLDSWELWPTTVDTTVEVTDAQGIRSLRTEPRLESITVADGLIAIIVLLITFTAARNIPGLLEITLLRRLPMEPSSRYAARMVSRYLIIVFGMVSAAGTVGVGWAQVQWLAAALTVGLGFGLQEIFANFVSGLIILFERPVRIGDVVTIGDVTGIVSRIQIRATTLTDWDRKEYIVPNKEFVTGRLLNWTLSDKTNRVIMKVGVSYGTDTELARELLLKVAAAHPNVLDDPSPVATFEGFGDSTLDLVLRAYLPDLDNRLGTITELHEAVDREFAVAEIEISFPQRDLHVRSMPRSS